MLLNVVDLRCVKDVLRCVSCVKDERHFSSNTDFLHQTNFPELLTFTKQSITGTVSRLRPVAVIKSMQLFQIFLET